MNIGSLVWWNRSSIQKSRRDGQKIARGFNPGKTATEQDKAPEGRQNY
jgi:hypothetical protein